MMALHIFTVPFIGRKGREDMKGNLAQYSKCLTVSVLDTKSRVYFG